MARVPRLNKIIGLLEEGKPVFGDFVANGNIDDLLYVVDAGYDFAIIDNEHVGIDFTNLRISLQFLLNRKRLTTQGNLQADPTPLVRISPNAREIKLNQWVLKHTLDHGAYGLVLPNMESVEEAHAAVVACRYFQRTGAPDANPRGERGWDPRTAAPYWGLSLQEYTEVADLWPLDPDGEILLMALCESANGVKNLPDVLREEKGIGVVFAAPGDLAVSMGLGPNPQDPQVQEALLTTLKACQQYGVPCGTVVFTPEDVDKRLQQGFQVFIAIHRRSAPALDHGRAVSSR